MKKLNGYMSNLIISMGTRIVMILLRLTRNILLARLLGPADRGLFALLSSLPELIAAFTNGGLNSAVGYYAARKSPMGLLLTQILVYGCLISTLLTVITVSLLRWYGTEIAFVEQLGLWIWLLIPAVPLAVLKSGFLTLHNADGRVLVFNVLRLIESFAPLALFLALWLIWRDKTLEAALYSWLGGLLLVVITGWIWMRQFHLLTLQWQPSSQGALLRFGAKNHLDVLFQQVLLRADYLIIGAILPTTALGHYAMAKAAAELLIIIPEAVTTPLMKRLLQQSTEMEALTPLALRVTATVMLIACICMAGLGEWLIIILFGKAYAPAYPALLGLLPGIYALCYASILRLDLLGKHRPGSLSIIMAVVTVINVLFNLWAIPQWGIVGAAICSSAAYIISAIAMLSMYCKLSKTPWYKTLIILPGDIKKLLLLAKTTH